MGYANCLFFCCRKTKLCKFLALLWLVSEKVVSVNQRICRIFISKFQPFQMIFKSHVFFILFLIRSRQMGFDSNKLWSIVFQENQRRKTNPLISESHISFMFLIKGKYFLVILVMRVNMKCQNYPKKKKRKEWLGNSLQRNVVMKLMAYQRNSSAQPSIRIKQPNEVSPKFVILQFEYLKITLWR